MKKTFNLKSALQMSTPALNAAILVLLYQITSASQVYFYDNVAKYTFDGDTAVYMSWLVPFAVEAATGVVIHYAIQAFGKKARLTSLILLAIFFALISLNYHTSQEGILAKGLDEVEKTAPDPMKALKEVEDKYMSQLNSINNSYQIMSTSSIDRQINNLEEELEAIQNETEKCRCPSWGKFQSEQKAKRNAVLKKLSRMEEQRLDIISQNNTQQKMLASQTAPIQEAMKNALKQAELENQKQEAAFIERKNNKSDTIAMVHRGLSIVIILLTVVKSLVKDDAVMLAFEHSLRKTTISKPAELKSKKPYLFEQDFDDLVYLDKDYLNLSNTKLAEILSKNIAIDGEITALARSISDWKKKYPKQEVAKNSSEATPSQSEPAKESSELTQNIKDFLINAFKENKTFGYIKTRYTNGDHQNLIPKMKEFWDSLVK